MWRKEISFLFLCHELIRRRRRGRRPELIKKNNHSVVSIDKKT
jgi:hypothetical protein